MSLVSSKRGGLSMLMQLLSDEIHHNLTKLQVFINKEYRVVDGKIGSKDGTGVLMDYFVCMVDVFQSSECQKSISLLKEDTRKSIFQVYGGFKDINEKADALKRAFRPWRASLYIETVMSFEKDLRSLAEKISQDIYELAVSTSPVSTHISGQENMPSIIFIDNSQHISQSGGISMHSEGDTNIGGDVVGRDKIAHE
jgi:hypothetical protein